MKHKKTLWIDEFSNYLGIFDLLCIDRTTLCSGLSPATISCIHNVFISTPELSDTSNSHIIDLQTVWIGLRYASLHSNNSWRRSSWILHQRLFGRHLHQLVGMWKGKPLFLLYPPRSPHNKHRQCCFYNKITDKNYKWQQRIPKPCSRKDCLHNRSGTCYDLNPLYVRIQYCNGTKFMQQMIVGKE